MKALDRKMVRGVLALLLVLAVFGLSLEALWHHHDDSAALRCAVCALHGAAMPASAAPELATPAPTPAGALELTVAATQRPFDQHPSRAPPLEPLS